MHKNACSLGVGGECDSSVNNGRLAGAGLSRGSSLNGLGLLDGLCLLVYKRKRSEAGACGKTRRRAKLGTYGGGLNGSSLLNSGLGGRLLGGDGSVLNGGSGLLG